MSFGLQNPHNFLTVVSPLKPTNKTKNFPKAQILGLQLKPYSSITTKGKTYLKDKKPRKEKLYAWGFSCSQMQNI